MVVGIRRLDLRIQGNNSLKGKRQIIKKIIERTNGATPRGGFRPAHAPYAMAAGLILTALIALLAWSPEPPSPGVELSGFYDATDPVAELRARSRQLEPLVQKATGRNSSERALLYRIADLDAELNRQVLTLRGDQDEIQQLWSRRVALLESLAEVRRTRAALQPAVY